MQSETGFVSSTHSANTKIQTPLHDFKVKTVHCKQSKQTEVWRMEVLTLITDGIQTDQVTWSRPYLKFTQPESKLEAKSRSHYHLHRNPQGTRLRII